MRNRNPRRPLPLDGEIEVNKVSWAAPIYHVWNATVPEGFRTTVRLLGQK